MSHAPRVPLTRRALLTHAAAAAAALPLLPPLIRVTGGAGSAFTTHAKAWDAFVEGATYYRRYTPQANAEARALLTSAIALDPDCARASAMLAATYRQEAILRWTADFTTTMEKALTWARTAVETARREPPPQPSLPHTLEQLAYTLTYLGDTPGALQAAREAVEVDPSYADGYTVWADALIYAGYPDAARRKTRQAIILHPAPDYPFFYDYHLGQAYYVSGFAHADGRYWAAAEEYLRAALQKNPAFRPARTYLVAALWDLHREAEAVQEMAILRAMGRPMAQTMGGAAAFRAYIRQAHPHADGALPEHLSDLWLAAEARLGDAV
jgi:adenylate cyclase